MTAPINDDKTVLTGIFIGGCESKTKHFNKPSLVGTNSVVSEYISTLKMHASTIMPKDSLESIEEALTSHNVTKPNEASSQTEIQVLIARFREISFQVALSSHLW